jgi:hypothetical protein
MSFGFSIAEFVEVSSLAFKTRDLLREFAREGSPAVHTREFSDLMEQVSILESIFREIERIGLDNLEEGSIEILTVVGNEANLPLRHAFLRHWKRSKWNLREAPNFDRITDDIRPVVKQLQAIFPVATRYVDNLL